MANTKSKMFFATAAGVAMLMPSTTAFAADEKPTTNDDPARNAEPAPSQCVPGTSVEDTAAAHEQMTNAEVLVGEASAAFARADANAKPVEAKLEAANNKVAEADSAAAQAKAHAEAEYDKFVEQAGGAAGTAAPENEAADAHKVAQAKLAKAKATFDEASSKVTSTKAELERAQANLAELKEMLADDKARVAAKKAVADAQSAFDQAKSAEEEARKQAETAQAALDLAEKNRAEKEAARGDARAVADAEEKKLQDLQVALKNAEAAHAAAVQKRDEVKRATGKQADGGASEATKAQAQKAVDDAKEAARLAEAAIAPARVEAEKAARLVERSKADAKKQIEQGSLGFFKQMAAENSGSAAQAVKVLTTPNYTTPENRNILDSTIIGPSSDATSLVNMEKAFSVIQRLNELRTQGGRGGKTLKPMLVDDYLMARAQLAANWVAKVKRSHPDLKEPPVAENIAWGQATGAEAVDRWYSEKTDYEAARADTAKYPGLDNMSLGQIYKTYPDLFPKIGHYLNIVDDVYGSTGAGYSDTNPSMPSWSQDNAVAPAAMPLGQYIERFNRYYQPLKEAVEQGSADARRQRDEAQRQLANKQALAEQRKNELAQREQELRDLSDTTAENSAPNSGQDLAAAEADVVATAENVDKARRAQSQQAPVAQAALDNAAKAEERLAQATGAIAPVKAAAEEKAGEHENALKSAATRRAELDQAKEMEARLRAAIDDSASALARASAAVETANQAVADAQAGLKSAQQNLDKAQAAERDAARKAADTGQATPPTDATPEVLSLQAWLERRPPAADVAAEVAELYRAYEAYAQAVAESVELKAMAERAVAAASEARAEREAAQSTYDSAQQAFTAAKEAYEKLRDVCTTATGPVYTDSTAIEAALKEGSLSLAREVTLRQGEPVTLTFAGLTPHADARVYLYSEPVFIDNLRADAEGRVRVSITTSASTQPGRHYVVVTSNVPGEQPTAVAGLNVLAESTAKPGEGPNGMTIVPAPRQNQATTNTMPESATPPQQKAKSGHGQTTGEGPKLANTGVDTTDAAFLGLAAMSAGVGLMRLRARRDSVARP
ncbi:hypothetical protein INS90_04175 [Trueperella pecoris]|uniref:SCP domain-containing protein n=1 Tax=Trueperella pecoris TaxID=2733571 RepID=A0A7M1R2G8_9ACTO|nr:CAP domain-containing protein [Trueperella pecoris]QOR48469.1 hypothetical protein INS90_04175 [Trueperella pecoris]